MSDARGATTAEDRAATYKKFKVVQEMVHTMYVEAWNDGEKYARERAASEIERQAARIERLEGALAKLRRGPDKDCWCEMAIGNPMVRTHSEGCTLARRALTPDSEHTPPTEEET